MTRGDKGKLFSLLVPLFPLPTQQDCVLPVISQEWNEDAQCDADSFPVTSARCLTLRD